jgi:hypothetical protein
MRFLKSNIMTPRLMNVNVKINMASYKKKAPRNFRKALWYIKNL